MPGATKQKKPEEVHQDNFSGNPLFVEPPYIPAHARPGVDVLNPQVHGPFLDDIRAAQEDSYREQRKNKPTKKETKRRVDQRLAENESVAEEQQRSVMRDDEKFNKEVTSKILEFAPPKLRPPFAEETPENHSEDSAVRDPRVKNKISPPRNADLQFKATEKVGVKDNGELEEKVITGSKAKKSAPKKSARTAKRVNKSAGKKEPTAKAALKSKAKNAGAKEVVTTKPAKKTAKKR
jgi:hypothetical protein